MTLLLVVTKGVTAVGCEEDFAVGCEKCLL